MLLRDYLDSFSILLALPGLSTLPPSHIELTREMPKDTLRGTVINRENHTVFIFFNTELPIFFIDVDAKHSIGDLGQF